MELTLRQALKSRKVRNINGYYPYEHLLNTIRDVYQQGGLLDFPVFVMLEKECENATNAHRLIAQKKINAHEACDYLLLDVVANALSYPIFVVKQELCESLYNTFCENKGLSVSRPFVDKGIVLMPKKINNSQPESVIYVFKKERHFAQEVEVISICCISKTVGQRGVSFFFLDKPNNKMEINKTDFLFNLFLYQESVKDKEPSSTELTAIPRGFGTAKNTNQKQIITPRMIGADYKPKTIRQESTGTHASPTTHWRSGHWRQQLIGKKENPDHKTIWIEPVLVNG